MGLGFRGYVGIYMGSMWGLYRGFARMEKDIPEGSKGVHKFESSPDKKSVRFFKT